jgi:hypothetical protein
MSEKVEKAKNRMIFSSQFLEGAKEGAIQSLATLAIFLVALKAVKQIVK